MRDIATKVDNVGDTLSASDFNADQNEFENVVTQTGQTLDPAGGPDTDLNMLGKGIADYTSRGNIYTDSGVANAYVLAHQAGVNLQYSPAYAHGFTVTFKTVNRNTGASTVNVNALGTKNLTLPNGTALPAYTIVENTWVTFTFNAASDRFELVLPAVHRMNRVVISASGTYNKPAGLRYLDVELIGGGGGGGGAQQSGGSGASAGGGGGAGGYLRKLFRQDQVGATEAITIGAAGTGGTPAAAGTNGGNTVFILLTAFGGTGGTNNNTNAIVAGGPGGTVGGAVDHQTPGGGGNIGIGGTGAPSGSEGGGSYWTGTNMLRTPSLSSAGSSAVGGTSYGQGGQGGWDNANVARNGGNGGQGVAILTEYF